MIIKIEHLHFVYSIIFSIKFQNVMANSMKTSNINKHLLLNSLGNTSTSEEETFKFYTKT
jgi:hypothetical protein